MKSQTTINDQFFQDRSKYLSKMEISLKNWATQNIEKISEQDEFVEKVLAWHAASFDEVWSAIE